MSEELKRNVDFRDKFRPHSSASFIHDIPEEWKEKGKMYRRVAESFRSDPFHINTALKKGWDFVLRPGTEIASKENSLREKENLHPDPIRVVAADGAVSYWMWIDEKRYQANLHQKDKERKARLKASITATKGPQGIHEKDNDIYDPLAQ